MNAKEAKVLAEEYNTGKSSQCYREVKEAIKSSASKGEFRAFYYEDIPTNVVTQLEAEGFTVEKQYYRNETDFVISWH